MAESPAPLLDSGVLERVLAGSLRRGGDFAEVFVEDRSATGISFDDRKVEEVSSGHDRGAGIRVVSGETTGFAHTSDLSERGLLAAAEAAGAVARQGGGGIRRVALSARHSAAPNDVAVLPSEIGKARKVELLLQADDIARSKGAAIVQVSAGYSDSRRRIQVANSDGLLTSDDRVRTRFSVVCVAAGDTGMQTGYESAALTLGFELFERRSVEEVADEAARRHVEAVGATRTFRRGARGDQERQRWHPVPRGMRARPRGGPRPEGQLRVHGTPRGKRREPARHARR